MRQTAPKGTESIPGALVRAIQALGRLFEALDPKHLTKNQRFTLAFDILTLIFLALSLFADLERIHKFILALAVLGILTWSHGLNFKS